jgi:uncharacterized protein (TIGR03067 family)
MNRAMLTLILVACAAAGEGPAKEKAPDDRQAIRGRWRPVRVTYDGKEIPAKQFKDERLTIDGKTFTYETGMPVNGRMRYGYRLDPSRSPKRIDFDCEGRPGDPGEGPPEFREGNSLAIYRLEGDTLTICEFVRLTLPETLDRPTAFDSKAGTEIKLSAWKRVKSPDF